MVLKSIRKRSSVERVRSVIHGLIVCLFAFFGAFFGGAVVHRFGVFSRGRRRLNLWRRLGAAQNGRRDAL